MRKLLLILTLCNTAGFATSIEVQQGGWSTGGPLLIAFTGQDSNGDGGLLVNELTQFHATWKTPGGALTEWLLSDIEPDGFVFSDIGNYLFFARNPEYSLVNSAFEGEALATVFDAFLFPVDSTNAAAEAVPEPGTYLLTGIGTIALLARRRYSRRPNP